MRAEEQKSNCKGKPHLYSSRKKTVFDKNNKGLKGNQKPSQLQDATFECLEDSFVRKTHFSRAEIDQLLNMYKHLTNGQDRMDRLRFRDILHNTFDMTDDLLMDRVFRAFDTNGDNYISMPEWVNGLSIFCRGTLDEKIKFCFFVYEINGDGTIERGEVWQFLKKCIVLRAPEEDSVEGIKELVDLILKKMDKDQDKQISFHDFQKSVLEDPLLIECFGQCLPDQKARDAFLALFSLDMPYIEKKFKF